MRRGQVVRPKLDVPYIALMRAFRKQCQRSGILRNPRARTGFLPRDIKELGPRCCRIAAREVTLAGFTVWIDASASISCRYRLELEMPLCPTKYEMSTSIRFGKHRVLERVSSRTSRNHRRPIIAKLGPPPCGMPVDDFSYQGFSNKRCAALRRGTQRKHEIHLPT